MKAVFDTNVLVAALIAEGVCAKLLTRARKHQFHLVTCPSILEELEHVLRNKISAGREEVRSAVLLVSAAVQAVVHPVEKVSGVCRDADDHHILACSLEAKADYLVTGDLDLLSLGSFRGTQIVTPRQFEMFFED